MRRYAVVFAAVFLALTALCANAAQDNPFDRHPIHFAEIQGVSIAYQDMGARDGEPVLLVMGLGAQMLHWGDTLVQRLIDSGYRVVLLDNRDAGLSQKFYELSAPPVWWMLLKQKVGLAGEPPYTLQDMAADAVGLLDHLQIERAHIVGASMGGMIVQIIAAEYPQRVSSMTSIMSSSGAPELPESKPEAIEALALAAQGADSRAQRIQNGVFIARAIGSPQFFDEVHARNLARRVANRGSYGPGMLRQLQAIMANGDRSPLLEQITVPSLVVHGEADPLLPIAHGRDTAEKIPAARFAAIPGMAHALEPRVSELVLRELVPFLRAKQQLAAD
ncbi:alpha/beta fold hydrolase [Microbulbifer marinus]|uniref:Pimeloyl-ACP methyl ester carboxylesterase n=1 Tax=Microbulbifer marinus TaxID=658218 RepID=A0A1H4APT1_9GAMM|nr:alpha/beta hydrolase [Microbulbifer marinus]SEA37788.1 Pimeloyl-ACP methyl ester carboxylesterase [Microbulbifer marinus]